MNQVTRTWLTCEPTRRPGMDKSRFPSLCGSGTRKWLAPGSQSAPSGRSVLMEPTRFERIMLAISAAICSRFGHVWVCTEEVHTPDTGYEGFECGRCLKEFAVTYY